MKMGFVWTVIVPDPLGSPAPSAWRGSRRQSLARKLSFKMFGASVFGKQHVHLRDDKRSQNSRANLVMIRTRPGAQAYGCGLCSWVAAPATVQTPEFLCSRAEVCQLAGTRATDGCPIIPGSDSVGLELGLSSCISNKTLMVQQ